MITSGRGKRAATLGCSVFKPTAWISSLLAFWPVPSLPRPFRRPLVAHVLQLLAADGKRYQIDVHEGAQDSTEA